MFVFVSVQLTRELSLRPPQEKVVTHEIEGRNEGMMLGECSLLLRDICFLSVLAFI
jgi:hypothetical protein